MANVSPPERDIALLPFEQSLNGLAVPGISSVTFFDVNKDGGFEAARAQLEAKVAEIVAANPWLTGRLVRSGACCCGAVWLRLPADPAAEPTERFFGVAECPEAIFAGSASPSNSYAQICKAAIPFLVPMGLSSIGSKAPLFRCTLLRSANAATQRFALVVSLSHTIGDGATYYQLYGMLSSASRVRALSPVRNTRFEAKKREIIGGQEDAWLMTAGMTLQVVRSKALRWKPKIAFRTVSLDWVARQKAAHAATVASDPMLPPFVSTNDLLVSWFFKRTRCAHALMAVNFRGKFVDDLGLTADDAGNYEAFELMCAPDFETPALVRQSLAKLRRCAEPPTRVPGFCASAAGRLGIATSWAGSLYQPLELSGGSQALHLPIFDAGEMCHDLILVFFAQPGKLALMLSVRDVTEAELDQEEAIDEKLSALADVNNSSSQS